MKSTFLSHVLWLGGPPDAGKTSVASELADYHGLQLYHFDQREAAHMARAHQPKQPAPGAADPENLTPEQRWLAFRPGEMAYATVDSWTDRFEFACDDLLAMPGRPAILAEGPGFFPDLVMMVMDDPRQAAFLMPTPEFQRASVERRSKPGTRDETSDPERATEALIARDLLMSRLIRSRAEDLGLKIIDVDGSRPVDDIVTELELYWAPWLHL